MRPIQLLVAALTCVSCARAGDVNVKAVEIDGTRLRVRHPDGRLVRDEELLGAVLVARVDGGIARAVRIDGLAPDANDPSREVLLYDLSAQDADGVWRPVCGPGARGFPLAGVWTERGEHLPAPGVFELTCTTGAIGKCVRMGYHPWKGERAWRQHQACTRMVRADYCGDGASHTRDGTPIDVFDTDGIQRDQPAPGMTFEAAWSDRGAICVRRTRVPEVLGIEELARRCGPRVEAVGETCREADALRDPEALVFDRS